MAVELTLKSPVGGVDEGLQGGGGGGSPGGLICKLDGVSYVLHAHLASRLVLQQDVHGLVAHARSGGGVCSLPVWCAAASCPPPSGSSAGTSGASAGSGNEQRSRSTATAGGGNDPVPAPRPYPPFVSVVMRHVTLDLYPAGWAPDAPPAAHGSAARELARCAEMLLDAAAAGAGAAAAALSQGTGHVMVQQRPSVSPRSAGGACGGDAAAQSPPPSSAAAAAESRGGGGRAVGTYRVWLDSSCGLLGVAGALEACVATGVHPGPEAATQGAAAEDEENEEAPAPAPACGSAPLLAAAAHLSCLAGRQRRAALALRPPLELQLSRCQRTLQSVFDGLFPAGGANGVGAAAEAAAGRGFQQQQQQALGALEALRLRIMDLQLQLVLCEASGAG